ncbi:MAG: T9SS type A sorting domain-containing protein [Bacteroidetes bacterium]|nr:T9SS type A sorting domain-containing protein [Bacteroidota bacterium]
MNNFTPKYFRSRFSLLLSSFFFFVFFVLFRFSVIAQNPDIKRTYHWYFGKSGGIDWISGNPVLDYSSNGELCEGPSSISDLNGNLLFYTDGDTVWNRNHQIMPNGVGLLGCTSSMQASLIIPQPGNDSLYYIFTTDGIFGSPCGNGSLGMNYSIVNIKMGGGLGDVVIKNILLFDTCSEKLTAVHHANNCDVWVLGQNKYNSDYRIYLLTDTGISNAIVQQSSIINGGIAQDGSGQMRFSNDGKKLANNISIWGADTLEIWDFDNATGVFSNPFKISLENTPTSSNTWLGLCFSPDNSKLYINNFSFDTLVEIDQFDLSSGIPSQIISSRTTIAQVDSTIFLNPQIGPDGKIYLTKYNLRTYSVDSLSGIMNPNAAGLACNFQYNALKHNAQLPYDNVGYWSLPDFVESYLNPMFTGSVCESGIEENSFADIFSIYPNPAPDYIWIKITSEKPKNSYDVLIYNILGKEIFEKKEINNKEEKISLKNITDNILLLQIYYNNQIIHYKLIKT